jgi:hypothetical protein
MQPSQRSVKLLLCMNVTFTVCQHHMAKHYFCARNALARNVLKVVTWHNTLLLVAPIMAVCEGRRLSLVPLFRDANSSA